MRLVPVAVPPEAAALNDAMHAPALVPTGQDHVGSIAAALAWIRLAVNKPPLVPLTCGIESMMLNPLSIVGVSPLHAPMAASSSSPFWVGVIDPGCNDSAVLLLAKLT
ncbi:MAG TPA: hypothetical protein VFW75_02115 [Acetobacteraceae bacterium]|nr:hypothetical protein [Acetobacteraceae bacterium]